MDLIRIDEVSDKSNEGQAAGMCEWSSSSELIE